MGLEDRLAKPDPLLLERILAEKDEAIARADGALRHLRNAKAHFIADQYDDLYWRLNLAGRCAIVWKLHVEALFGYKVLASVHRVRGLVERADRALSALQTEAASADDRR